MAEPWQCPACKTWIRADVAEHRCPPDGGVTAKVPPSGGGAGGGDPGPIPITGGAWPQRWTTTGTTSTPVPGVAVNYP